MKVNTCNQHEALEHVRDQVMIGFSFASDWFRRWHKFSRPVTERRKVKPNVILDYFQHSIENFSGNNYKYTFSLHSNIAIPCSHVFPSDKSFTPVGHAQDRPWVFNKQRWLHPPLKVELQGFLPVSRENIISVSPLRNKQIEGVPGKKT